MQSRDDDKDSEAERGSTRPSAGHGPRDDETLCFRIPHFCRVHGLSVATYYRLAPSHRPATIKIGRHVVISREAAARWRAELESRG
jgi:hypothetical protein